MSATKAFLPAILAIPAILAAASAHAEDGYTVFLGSAFGAQYMRVNGYDLTDTLRTYTKNSGDLAGPFAELRYEKNSVFVRGFYDYLFLSNSTSRYNTGGSDRMRGFSWRGEGDAGYRFFNGSHLSLTGYAGLGSRAMMFINKQYPSYWGTLETPYAAFGGIGTYSAGGWSAGLDVSLLVPFDGTFRERFFRGVDTARTGAGTGTRVQIPITYTILPKSGRSPGVQLLAAPFFEYIDTGKSGVDSFGVARAEQTVTTYGVKAGLGFSF